MTAPTNVVSTAVAIGNREDLEDVIYRVAPEKTPLISNIGKSSAKAILHEWQVETLATPVNSNAHLEGDDVGSLDAGHTTARVSNYCQIFTKSYGVTRTEEIVDKAGRASELNFQKVVKGIELRRDMEMSAFANLSSRAESGATTRRFAGILAWLSSNVSRGSGGSSGGFSAGTVAAATNGTQRTFTEALVKSVLSTGFGNGASPSQAYMGPSHKQQFSAFTGIASIRRDVTGDKMATIIGAADVYVSDFGNIVLIPHPYALTRDCVLVDPEMLAIGVLDGTKSKRLGDTGDSEKYLITNESTLVVKNEKAHAVVADLT